MHASYLWFSIFFAILVVTLLSGCAGHPTTQVPTISHHPWGTTTDGKEVSLFTLRNSQGVEEKISTYGGIIVSVLAPDRYGKMGDVVLGHEDLANYQKSSPYFGSLIGRYGNRIAHGKFTLNGKEYSLATNNGPNALHGGLKGFDKVVWDAKIVATVDGPSLKLSYVSKDGEEGYPGTLTVTATYRLTEENGIRLDYEATTDKDTIINLTQHSYFNLAGHGDILNHEVMINADKFTPVNEKHIPTGELKPVEGTPFDFRRMTKIGARIDQENEQLKFGKGYDHNYALNAATGGLRMAARVHDPESGRVLEVWTTEPGMQFYSGNFLNGTLKGKGGWVYQKRNGFCMEPQHFPDSPNQPKFPSVVLKPGQTFKSTIIYRFDRG